MVASARPRIPFDGACLCQCRGCQPTAPSCAGRSGDRLVIHFARDIAEGSRTSFWWFRG